MAHPAGPLPLPSQPAKKEGKLLPLPAAKKEQPADLQTVLNLFFM